jgi:protein-S-isoprenylcysteine O-methyltransferase Ste14/predicted DCC family thiol-disulfide oxidoreductase YuxK
MHWPSSVETIVFDAELFRLWALEQLDLVRGVMLLCCLGWVAVLFGWLKPSPRAVRAGVLAVIVQLGVGTLLDAACVRLGAWTYVDLPLSFVGVPLDLHLDWALLWGFGLVWLSDRWPGPQASGRAQAGYLLACVALTVCFDAAIHHWMIFLQAAAWWWWIADAVFLTVTLGLTLWMYRSVGLADEPRCGLGLLPPLRPALRSALVVLPFAGLFFVLLPEWIHDAAESFGVASRAAPLPWLPGLLAIHGALLMAWGVHEFARRGRGTPVPWDPPQQLVTTGPYAFIANPMQVGGLALVLACAAACPTWVGALYAFDVLLVVAFVFRPAEHHLLSERHGEAALRWFRDVPAFRPRLQPALPPEGQRPIVFFDENCGTCQTWVRCMTQLDDAGALRFAPFHGLLANEILPPGGAAASGRRLVLHEPALDPADPALTTSAGEAVLRLLGWMPFPLCTVAALAAVPGCLPVVEGLYRLATAARQTGGACHTAQHDISIPPASQ